MSRRRRKGNPLLGRILLISVLAHIIVLPILARFGAFDRIKREFVTANVTVAPPPAEHEKPPERKAAAKKAAPKARAVSNSGKAARTRGSAPHPNVVASAAAPGEGAEDGSTFVDPAGTGKVGTPPTECGTKGNSPSDETPTPPTTAPEAKPEPTAPAPKETPTTDKMPPPAVDPIVKPAVVLSPEPISQPNPEVPDDLRNEAIDKTTVVMIEVSPEGSALDVKVESGSGISELDTIATNAAKKWKFRPASRDGVPVAGRVRLHVRFKVD